MHAIEMNLSRRELLGLIGAGATVPGSGTETPTRRGESARSPARSARRPDIAVVLLDDVGYADLGCFGSEIGTPAIDALASRGLIYTNFHVTALCTPTRACLLTGRNAHRVGAGTISEWARKEPGYAGAITREAATLPELLKPLGYVSGAFGKWHLAPIDAANASGPFEQWPTGRGFDRWYGFHGPVADHWFPELWENTSPVTGRHCAGYHLSEDLVEQAIAFTRDQVAAAPERPIFTWLALGACHWPLHAPNSDLERQRGRYDAGWDAIRAARFRRQRAAGLLPAGTRLAPRNAGIPAWQELTADERRFAARGQELYAAFLEHCDRQIGRFVEALHSLGRLSNTLLLVLSDNGASREGGRLGAADLRRNHYIAPETLAELLEALPELGSARTFPAYAQGWAQVSNTPLKWYKSSTFGGGVRAPLIVRWPDGGLPQGRRRQFHHAIDLVPTVLELVGGELPEFIGGHRQMPLQGESMAYSFDAAENDPTRKALQHFETIGDRAIWARGWKATAKHVAGRPFDGDVWELYHIDADFSELEDLAAHEPRRLAALQALWADEAAANSVLPLDDRTVAHFAANVQPQRPQYVFYPGMARLDRLSCPDIARFDHEIVAHLEIDEPGREGTLLAFGTSLAGYELAIERGFPTYDYVFSRAERTTLRSSSPLDVGQHRVGLSMRRAQGMPGADVVLTIDGTRVAEARIPRLWPLYAAAAGMRCGLNSGAPVAGRHAPPFRFAGTLHRVVVLLAMPG